MGKRIYIQTGVAPWQTATAAETSDRETRSLIRSVLTKLGEVMANADRIDAALTGIAGDVAGLKAAYQALVDAQETQTAEAVEAARVEFESGLDALAAKAEALDAETPNAEAPVE